MDKLGVYIPTYNRKDKLRACLESFIPQLKKYGFPIYISDNGSTDGTEKVVKELRKKYKKITYSKNKKNLGYAANLAKVLRMGNTEFVWAFGDDDVIVDGAIDDIMKHLDKYDFLQINAVGYSHDLSKMTINRMIPLNGDMVYDKGMHESVILNARIRTYAGFMGGIITRLDYLKAELDNIKDMSKMDFLHTVLFYKSIVNKKGRLIAKPIIKLRGGGNQGGREVEIWMSSFPAALDKLRPEYSDKTLRVVGKVNSYFLVTDACMSKYKNPSGAMEYWKYVSSNKNVGVVAKGAAFLILRLPIPFVCSIVYHTWLLKRRLLKI